MNDVYTDGACKGNPGKGGWGWVEYMEHGREVFAYGGSENTTNNKMEMTAIIEFLEYAKIGGSFKIFSDSQYTLKGLVNKIPSRFIGQASGWLVGWKKRGWKTAKNQPVANRALWEKLEGKCIRHFKNKSTLEFVYVKGHSGDKGNDRADELANIGVP